MTGSGLALSNLAASSPVMAVLGYCLDLGRDPACEVWREALIYLLGMHPRVELVPLGNELPNPLDIVTGPVGPGTIRPWRGNNRVDDVAYRTLPSEGHRLGEDGAELPVEIGIAGELEACGLP